GSAWGRARRSSARRRAPAGSLEERLAHERERDRPLGEERVVEFLEGIFRAELLLVVLAQGEDLELPPRVIHVSRVARAALRLHEGDLARLVALVLEELDRG